MIKLNQEELNEYANTILNDYDSNNPSSIFKTKIKLSNNDALLIQSKISKLRIDRCEEVMGYKIGCVSKDTQKKMGFTQPAWGTLWKSELYKSGVELNKKDYSKWIRDQTYSNVNLRKKSEKWFREKYIDFEKTNWAKKIIHSDSGKKMEWNCQQHNGFIVNSCNW